MPGNTVGEDAREAVAGDVARVVLDTNVWLDWLVFDDPAARPLRQAVEAGRLAPRATLAMRSELIDVVGRPQFAGRVADAAALLAEFDRLVSIEPVAPACGLLCSDPDDQKFIDLAVAAGARWLVTRDNALLVLGRRLVRATGPSVVRPDALPANL